MISIKVDEIKYTQIKQHYSPYYVESNGEYVDFVARKEGVIITGFLSKKQHKTITFDGANSLTEATLWDSEIKEENKKTTTKEDWVDLSTQIGSDEVGVGDFVLPMIVVASYVKASDIALLKKLGVHDSKKLTDEKILSIGEELIKSIEHSKLTLSNDKYNEMYQRNENINSLKAKMHNRALYNMYSKHPETVGVYVDQFVSKTKYYEYLNDENEPQVKEVAFKTKGESYFPSVAVSSVIARYAFLKEKEKLEEKYHMTFPFGASTKVNKFAKKFINKFGIDEFNKIAKKNFANYREVVSIKLI